MSSCWDASIWMVDMYDDQNVIIQNSTIASTTNFANDIYKANNTYPCWYVTDGLRELSVDEWRQNLAANQIIYLDNTDFDRLSSFKTQYKSLTIAGITLLLISVLSPCVAFVQFALKYISDNNRQDKNGEFDRL